MGRVYEALKRAAAGDDADEGKRNGDASKATKAISPSAEENGHNGSLGRGREDAFLTEDTLTEGAAAAPVGAGTPELFLRQSKHFQAPETAHEFSVH